MFVLLIYFLVGLILVGLAILGLKQVNDPDIQKWGRLVILVVAGLVVCWFLLSLVSGGLPSMGHVRLP